MSGRPQVDMPLFGRDGVGEGANAGEQVSASVVRFTFPDGQLAGGEAWSILAVPEGLDFHGATMPVPQSSRGMKKG